MDDNHVRNARNWCNRQSRALLMYSGMAEAYAMDAPDGAAMAAENEAEHMALKAFNLDAWEQIFTEEMKRRGLS